MPTGATCKATSVKLASLTSVLDGGEPPSSLSPPPAAPPPAAPVPPPPAAAGAAAATAPAPAAVDPAAQGQGHSSKLLRRVNELADAENLPCYLFTAGATGKSSKQVAVYSRFGYETVEERTIADFNWV